MDAEKKTAAINIEAHLHGRGVSLSSTRVIIDKAGFATFPMFNLSGQWIGYMQYNPLGDKKAPNDPKNGKYFCYISPAARGVAVWGIETVKPETKRVYIVEGIFDAVKLHNAGVSALAVLTANPSPQLVSWLRTLNKEIVAVMDRDAAGAKLAKAAHASYVVPAPYKDLGEMPQEEVNAFVSSLD